MKLLLVTLIAVAAIAVNICETNAFPANVDGEEADRELMAADRDCGSHCDDGYHHCEPECYHHGRAMKVAPDAKGECYIERSFMKSFRTLHDSLLQHITDRHGLDDEFCHMHPEVCGL